MIQYTMIKKLKVTDKEIMTFIGMDCSQKFYRYKKNYPKMIEAVRNHMLIMKLLGA